MSLTLRIVLIVVSVISFVLCVKKIKQAKLQVINSVIWMTGSIILIIISIFSDIVKWISVRLGFMAPVNFVFLVVMAFLLIEVFVNNIRITELNEKIKELNHYIALEEYEKKQKNSDNE